MEAQTKLKQNGHGGARANSGRKAPLGRRVLLTVRVSPGLREAIVDKAGPEKGGLTRYIEDLCKKDLGYVPKDGSSVRTRLNAVGLPETQPPAPTREINVPAIAEQRLAQSQAWQVLQLKRAEAAEITARPPAEKVGAPTMTEEERRAAERQARSRFMHGAGTKPKLPPR